MLYEVITPIFDFDPHEQVTRYELSDEFPHLSFGQMQAIGDLVAVDRSFTTDKDANGGQQHRQRPEVALEERGPLAANSYNFV